MQVLCWGKAKKYTRQKSLPRAEMVSFIFWIGGMWMRNKNFQIYCMSLFWWASVNILKSAVLNVFKYKISKVSLLLKHFATNIQQFSMTKELELAVLKNWVFSWENKEKQLKRKVWGVHTHKAKIYFQLGILHFQLILRGGVLAESSL